jgi:[acyl-carrier-protein] S-malonyltransferase
MFPGQGAQSIAMGEELRTAYPAFKKTIDEASEVLGKDLVKLINEGPETDLNRADLTQPAILAVSVAAWRTLHENLDKKIEYMAGHSLGEYSTLVCSGSLDFADALKLVRRRGELMLQAVPEGTGGMAAVLGLADEDIQKACDETSGDQVVSPVNYNSPGQVVIAGHKEAVEKASQACLDKGASKVIPLAVSVPSHCELMKPAAEEFKAHLNEIEFKTPEVSVVSSVDVKILKDSNEIVDTLIRQLYSPVRWTETVHRFEAHGVTDYIDCGPGKILAGLNKRINRRSVVHVMNNQRGFDKLLESLAS